MKVLRLSKTNAYLIETPNGYLLIDTGYELDKKAFSRQLEKYNISIDGIKFIYLTHHHDDHVGLLNTIITENNDITVIMNEHCSRLITKGINSREYGGGWCCKGMKTVAELYRKINKEWNLSFSPYIPRDNDIILKSEDSSLENILGVNIRSIYTPGHTIDSISLIDSNGNVFCGDAAANYLKWAGTKYAPAFITDFKQFYDTWDKFFTLGAKIICPSHGKPFSLDKLTRNIHKLSNEKMGLFEWD